MKKVIKIEIQWVKNRTWGYGPKCNAVVCFDGGTEETIKKYRCSGYGYDKLSTVIALIYNNYLANEREKYFSKKDYFDGGAGTNSYERISEVLGGKLERVYGDNTFDFYVFTKNEVTNEI